MPVKRGEWRSQYSQKSTRTVCYTKGPVQGQIYVMNWRKAKKLHRKGEVKLWPFL